MNRSGRQPDQVYCLAAPGIEDAMLAQLEDDLASHPHEIGVFVERRRRTRRSEGDRRATASSPPKGDARRLIRSAGGRRVAERRRHVRAWPAGALLERRLQRQCGPVKLVRVVANPDAEMFDALRLVARFQAGDTAAFRELYELSFPKIYAYFRSALSDRGAAEDQAQEVFIRVFRGLPTYEIRGVPFEAWLFRIARNQLAREQRRQQPMVLEDPTVHGGHEREDNGNGLAASSPDKALLDLVRSLPPAQRQVIVLRFVLDLDWNTIAIAVGRSPGAARQLEQRAFATLRTRLESRDAGLSVHRMPLVRHQALSPVASSRRNALAA